MGDFESDVDDDVDFVEFEVDDDFECSVDVEFEHDSHYDFTLDPDPNFEFDDYLDFKFNYRYILNWMTALILTLTSILILVYYF